MRRNLRQAQLRISLGRGYDLGEPSGAAVAAARRAGSPWSEQMDRKMLRFVEKTRNSHRQNAPQRGQKCCQRLDLRFHYLNTCTVNCLDKSEHRGLQTDKTPPARTGSVDGALSWVSMA